MASADVSVSPSMDGENSMSAGEFVLKKLFAEFVALSEKKLQNVSQQQLDYPLSKALQRGEDPHFDQLLNALNEVASFCLTSILTSIFNWRDMEIQQCRSNTSWSTVPSGDVTDSPFPANKRDKENLTERQELAIEFLFCLVLIEVLTQLSVHPVPESFIHTIEDSAFRHFKMQESLKDRTNTNPNVQNMKKIADLYAEVVGVLSQSRFHSVRKRFFHEIRDTQNNSATIISIIEGMSFIRVKMFPVEELEQWFTFLQECASYFLDSGREKIKHAMCALLVEILLPVASVIKFEASLPVVKKFVTMLYSHCYEHAKRGRHSTAYIPLVTVLLAISEQHFFLNHWHTFLMQMIMQNIRRGDSKVQRTALEALNRLVWVYMVRIKGESNITTFNRLRLILEVLFPRGQKGIQPKDMPLNLFVKLIQFISRERIEYGMHEVLELLSLGRSRTNINPERMIIGLRAFLLIADSLEKKEGDPPMPLNVTILPSSGPQRVKNKFLSTTLTNETARKIGISNSFPKVRRALDGILRALDHSVGRPFTSTNPGVTGRSEEEVLGGVKSKLDLLKTCVAAIPRIMPEGMTKDDLIDLLSRLTIHVDHELVRAAFNCLQGIITNFPSWRHDIARIFALFILRDIPDSCPLVLEAGLKMLLQLISLWKTLISTEAAQAQSTPATPTSQQTTPTNTSTSTVSEAGSQKDGSGGGEMYYCVPWIEACALVTLCSYRSVTRRFSLVLLREAKSLHEALKIKSEQTTVMEIVEKATPTIIKRYLATLTVKERTELRLTHQSLNLTWMADRSSCFLEQGGSRDSLRDAWAQCLAGLLEPHQLPELCPTSVHIAWPHAFHRMTKAYYILDPGSVAHEKGERPSSIKGRRPVISTVEMFLWRNYLIFVSCTAPPSTSLQASLMSSGDSSMMEGSNRELNARNLFHKVVPLIIPDGEIREVAVTALGMIHPNAFGDLVEELGPVIHESLDQKRGDNLRKRRRREVLRVQITRVFALNAVHGCFRQSPMTRTEKGEVSPVFLEFIDGIKNYLESENDLMTSFIYIQELRLYFSALIANIITSLPKGPDRLRLFVPEIRYNLFYLFANWCGLFGLLVRETEPETRRNTRASALSFNALQAMSALLCCGPVFHPTALDKDSTIYRWLKNMLSSGEPRIQTLGRKTVQMLLENNTHHTLLSWVIDHCYESKAECAQLCFHALSNTLADIPNYPCDMVTVLHVVLYKTADIDYTTRERATHLLQILDKRFFAVNGHGGDIPGSRLELLGCLTSGAFSQNHVCLSKELAMANPELTLPMFCEMVHRFEMSPQIGRQSILQYMVPWLHNVELVEEFHPIHSTVGHAYEVMGEPISDERSNSVLIGSGWGSPEGTKVVLHNLFYITAKYGDEYLKEVEKLWCALCTWPQNIRTTLNYLARLTCVSSNLHLMIQQAKRIMVCFSKSQPHCAVAELMRDLQSVEMLSADIQVTDSPPFYHVASTHSHHRYGGGVDNSMSRQLSESLQGAGWAESWRSLMQGGRPVPLPLPTVNQYYASVKSMFKPTKQPCLLHRCNFALILLSELVIELQQVDWSRHLPLLLHIVLLGLDLFRPMVFEHSKKLLGNLVVVLACKDDKVAALQAKFAQQELFLRSPSSNSVNSSESDHHHSSSKLHLSGSADSIHESSTLLLSSLSIEARELVQFVSTRDTHRRPPWPFADLYANRLNPSGDVPELSGLVGKILHVFEPVSAEPLKEKWAKIALQWATSSSSHQYASQSFQVCRALQLSLSSFMFREVLARLAECASEEKEDMQSYVLEIVLTLESAVDHVEGEALLPSNTLTSCKYPELPHVPSDVPDSPGNFSPPLSADSGAGVSRGGVPRRRHSRGKSVTMSRPSSAKARMDYSPGGVGVGRGHGGMPSRPMSPSGRERQQVYSPSHHKSTTVTCATTHGDQESTVAMPVRPHSTIFISHTAPMQIPEGQETPFNAPHEPSRTPSSPHKGTPPEMNELENRVASEGGAPGGLASAPETKQSKDKDNNVKESTSVSTIDVEKETTRPRKSSEPPPSLQALFDHDMASSRRWMHKQVSADEVHIAHPKQHSFDSSHLRSVTPQSPKHGRKLKSPSTSDKNSPADLEGSGMHRAPSHPHLNSATSTPQVFHARYIQPTGQPIVRAHSTQQLKMEDNDEEAALIKRSNSGGNADLPRKENVPSIPPQPTTKLDKEMKQLSLSKESLSSTKDISQELKKATSKESLWVIESSPSTLKEMQLAKETSTVIATSVVNASSGGGLTSHELNKENRERSAPSRDTQTGAEGSIETTQAPLINQQTSPLKPHVDVRRRNSSQYALRRDLDSLGVGGKKLRPSSMIEYSFRYGPQFSIDMNPTTPDLIAQLFWTAVSLLESDFEGEYTMALRLLSKVFDHLDLHLNDTYDRLEVLQEKMKWSSFPGAQTLLLKGLTLDATSEHSRELLSRITLHSTRNIFDPTSYAGLPLNIMALMPVLVHHFDSPTEHCVKVVSNIQQACTSVNLASEEAKTKLVHMSKMFQMYATKDYHNNCDVWLAGICRYLSDAYVPLAAQVLSLLADMLEKGCVLYHRPVLRLLYEYLRLQDPNNTEIKKQADHIMTIATQHMKGVLWREALDLLKLAVTNSASLVQPPTRGLPVDLGLFNQTLPGPTLQFTMNLHHGSPDLNLSNTPAVTSSWKRPHACQKHTRERLLSVLNACVPVPLLMSSPSVVFTDEQALIGEKGTLYSSASDEAASTITSINPDDVLESSQPESQVYINAVGMEFHFLESLDYMYDKSSSEGETPGPFSRSFQALDTELEEKEEDGSLHGSLSGSHLSLAEMLEGQEDDEGAGGLIRVSSPEPTQSPDASRDPRNIKQKSPEKSPLPVRRFPRSPEQIRRSLDFKHRSPDPKRKSLENKHLSPNRSPQPKRKSMEVLLHVSSYESKQRSPENKQKTPERMLDLKQTQRSQKDIKEKQPSPVVVSSPNASEGHETPTPVKMEHSPSRSETDEESDVMHSKSASEESGTLLDIVEQPETSTSEPTQHGMPLVSPTLKVAATVEDEPSNEEGTQEPHENNAVISEDSLDEALFDMLEGNAKTADSTTDQEKHVTPVSQSELNVAETEPKKIMVTRSTEESLEALAKLDEVLDLAAKEGIEEDTLMEEEESKSGEAQEEKPDEEVQGSPRDSELEGSCESTKGSAEVKLSPAPQGGSDTVEEPREKERESGPVGVQMTERDERTSQEVAFRDVQPDTETPQESGLVEDVTIPEFGDKLTPGPDAKIVQDSEPIEMQPEDPESKTAEDSKSMQTETLLSQDAYEQKELKLSQDAEPPEDKMDSETAELSSNSDMKASQESSPKLSQDLDITLSQDSEQADIKSLQDSLSVDVTLSQNSTTAPITKDTSHESTGGELDTSHESDQTDLSQEHSRTEPIEETDKPPDLKEDKDSPESRTEEEGKDTEMSYSPLETSTEWMIGESSSIQQTPGNSSKFLNFPSDEIETVWFEHVTELGHSKLETTAIHTYFLFNRLFGMLKLQFCSLTREACNYLGEAYNMIASHFLVTTEILLSQFELPKIYIDTEMITKAGLLEQHIFLVLELQENLTTYMEKRQTVHKSLSVFKRALRQDPTLGSDDPALSLEQAALNLCRAVHKFHFQLLVLLGSYVKLLNTVIPLLESCGTADICRELTEVKLGTEEAVLVISRGPSPPFIDESAKVIEQLASLSEAIRILEDTLNQKQYMRGIQLLHSIRKQWKTEEVLGLSEDDDVDCLFFLYARYLTDRQEGVVLLTNTEHKLSEVHAKLMAQNISLHSLLEQTERSRDNSHDQGTPSSIRKHRRTRSDFTFTVYKESSV